MIGKSLLHYEIKAQLGKGGMGEVFAARDTKLGRDVAIKVLPAELAGDPEREARFQREARSLASLQHPNVASVYGFEECEGNRFLVMELVVGSELTRRMAAGPVPVPEALAIARQIAAGLEAAHESGIVHRDLKPANIMETESGEVKILDFGLAQAWLGDGARQGESTAMPTITAAMTIAGTVLGTAAYMSPEQARGGSVDRRTDIWAFGVIMFEMLTGKRLFEGETASDTLAAVLRADPEWDLLPVAEAPALCRLVERCLERNPKQRLRDIGEARIFLQDGSGSGSHLSFSHLSPPNVAADLARGRAPALLLAGVTVACLAVGTLVGWKVLARPAPAPVLHAMIPPPKQLDYEFNSSRPGPAMLSPDGTMLAFTATDDENETMLYLRYLDKGESTVMSGTKDAAYPFWSPDGKFVGFYDNAGKKLKKVAVAGGPPVTLCPSENMKGGSWNRDGDIIFAPSFDSGIWRVPASGGEPVRLTKLDPDHNSHRHPRFLPDGRSFLYIARLSSAEGSGVIYLASLDSTVAPRRVAESQAQAEYIDGKLLTVREGVLMATPFDPGKAQVDAGGGTPLVESILTLPAAVVSVYSVSNTGMMVYQTGATNESGRVLATTDLANGASVPLGEPGQFYHPAIAPDGKRAVIEVRNASNEGTDLWLVDLQSGLRTRFTFASGDEVRACWSPDGTLVYYESRQPGLVRIMQQPVEGQGGESIVLESKREIFPSGLSPDGRLLLLDFEREDGKTDMRRLRLDSGSPEPVVVADAGPENLGGGRYSPDGRWIAYHTASASGWDVFVMPAAGGARKWQVTTEGTVYPKWSRDGRELWVLTFSGELLAFSVDGSGETFRVGPRRRTVTVPAPDNNGSYYDMFPDGKRILQTGTDPAFKGEVSFLHLVTDWRRGLLQ